MSVSYTARHWFYHGTKYRNFHRFFPVYFDCKSQNISGFCFMPAEKMLCCSEDEKFFSRSFPSWVGMKAWYCNLAGIVTASSNLALSNSVAKVWFSLLLRKISVSLQLLFAYWNKAWGVNMWYFGEYFKLERAACLFIFGPMPSHASLPSLCTIKVPFCWDTKIFFMGLEISKAPLIFKM